MVILANEHLASLDGEKSDSLIHTLYTRFKPMHQSYMKVYTDWKKASGIHQGTTQTVEELLQQLSSVKIGAWDNKISAEVGENSSDHTTLLPMGRKPFQSGGIDARVTEVESLAKRLAQYPSLSAVKTDVHKFHAQMEKERHTQQTKEEDVQLLSDALETERKKVSVLMYANLGLLMDKFAGNPQNIARFFNLEVLRETGPDSEDVQPNPPTPPVS